MVECKICLLHFDSQNLRPMVGSCGHTVCNACMLQIGAQCSVCRGNSFENPVVNFHLLELVETEKNKPTTGIEEKLASLEEKFEKRLNDNLDKMMNHMSEKLEKIEEKMKSMAIDKTIGANKINTKIENLGDNLHRKIDLIYDSLSEIKKCVKNDYYIDSDSESLTSDEEYVKNEAIDENLKAKNSNLPHQETSKTTTSLKKCLFELKPPMVSSKLSRTIHRSISTSADFFNLLDQNNRRARNHRSISNSTDMFRLLDQNSGPARRSIRRCCRCNFVLPEKLQTREDGVSVNCTCGMYNIIVPPKQGFKWVMSMCTNGEHFHQWPLAQECFERQKCPVCSEVRMFLDARWSPTEVVHDLI